MLFAHRFALLIRLSITSKLQLAIPEMEMPSERNQFSRDRIVEQHRYRTKDTLL